jgi:RimJ/RimL family protein N-acetyltransferase
MTRLAVVSVLGIDHVEVAAPAGCEAAARAYYGELIGLVELPRPSELCGRGGVWFAAGAQQLHVGVAADSAPARKAHPALRVTAAELARLADRLAGAGADVRWDGERRLHTVDPWGNRLELLAAAGVEILTARLRLRGWTPADEAPMAAINADPEVTRHLNRAVDEAAVAAFLGRARGHWDEHGFGWFAIESRDDGRLLGFAGVSYPTFMPELAARPELAWRLARAAWGQGLATEAARAARDDAFARLRLPELISIIHPDNERSQRVAVKLGMAPERQALNPVLGRPVDVWQVGRDA